MHNLRSRQIVHLAEYIGALRCWLSSWEGVGLVSVRRKPVVTACKGLGQQAFWLRGENWREKNKAGSA